jgi:hypothetical protein
MRWPRLIPTFRAAAVVVGSTLLLDVFLRLALGHTPDWFPGTFDDNVFQQFGSRLAKVQQMQAAGQIDTGRLIVALGISPVREDCDPAILAANDPDKRQWLILGAQGRTFATLDVYVRAFMAGNIHPRQAVLGILPTMLHEDDLAIPVDAWMSRLPHHLRHFQIHHALLDVSWLYRNTTSLVEETNLTKFEATKRLRSFFGLPMSATYPLENDAFKSWTSVQEDRSDDAHMALQWWGHQQLLVPEQFQSINRQVDAFAASVRRLRSTGAEVTLVLMPETSRLRAIYPPIVEQRFREALNIASAGLPLKLIDMRDSIADDFFWDDAHLNPRGRQIFSAKFPALIP